MKAKRISFVFAVAILCLALACTALAVGLGQSARYGAIRTAREAVMSEYGLDTETIGLLYEQPRQEKDGWVVELLPVKYIEKIGEYTVTLAADGSVESVIWEHDGLDLSGYAADDLTGPAWEQPQLAKLLEMERAYHKDAIAPIETAPGEEMSRLEKAAARDSILREMAEQGVESFVMHVLPGEGDLTEEEALQKAKEAVLEKYGMPLDTLDDYEIAFDLLKYADKDEATYRVYANQWLERRQEYGRASNSFYVAMGATSGEIEGCYWSTYPDSPGMRRLPEGSLADYEEAVGEFVEDGSFDYLPSAEKAQMAKRMQEAGFGDLLPYEEYLAPGADDMAEADAVDTAKDVLRAEYGFTDEGLALFAGKAALVAEDEGRVWTIQFSPNLPAIVRYEFEENIGEYTVRLAAEDGALIRAEWTLEADAPDGKYTASNWASAKAWDGTLLAWAVPLIEEYTAWTEFFTGPDENGDYPLPTMEEKAEMDQKLRDVGFSAAKYGMGLPGEGDLTKEEAIALAKKALIADYALDAAMLDEAHIYTTFYVGNPEHTEWRIMLFPPESAYEDYTVTLNGRTGEVLYAAFTATGNG